MMGKNSEGKYQCYKCNKSYICRQNLYHHNCGNVITFHCQKCSKTFSNKYNNNIIMYIYSFLEKKEINTMDSHNIIGFKYRGATKSYPRVANQLRGPYY